jgi:hypothetical protein
MTAHTADPRTPDWHQHLAESVSVLGAAAYELYGAQQQARHTAWTCDPVRLVPFPGLVTVPGAEPARPHDEALWHLTDLYLGLAHHLKQVYENAALGYAHGAAHALTSVLRAEQPCQVELTRDRAGRYCVPAAGLPDLSESISKRAGGEELARLREVVMSYEECGDTLDTDGDLDTDLADAAYAYGEHAKAVLQHLLQIAVKNGFAQAS